MAFPNDEQLKTALSPVLERYGVDIEAIKISPAGKKTVVAIAVDKDGRIDSDTIEALSRDISAWCDAQEEAGVFNFGAGYTLEVSTPGVDLPLTLPRHWRRNRGRAIAIAEAHEAREDGNPKGRQGQKGKKATTTLWRIGALDAQEENVILITKHNKQLVVRAAQLAHYAGCLVEVEFAQPTVEERELVALTFDEAMTWREEHNK
ncbi:ribosome maturation factor RimP [Corynebacterium sp. sy017]|uniref:ribosome maturation factor RimP n=1 Tax=unclassified Corynebacterium TaxID=2624378 RepID=UPI0011872CA8|nr:MULTISPECIES: ribosome maturation factor RimP [unclassified Corynebacterium]MBP3087829.1 ribosome maturation factor RimP [Corynebacterium sp. sy017]TSD92372.1 ribosome maturation factor RimP [Corynebacterium sp. SY003]